MLVQFFLIMSFRIRQVIFNVYLNTLSVANSWNLIDTTDVAEISGETYNNISKSTFGKLQYFWNLLSRSTMASDKVFEHFSRKFTISIFTGRNSKYDATKKILKYKNKLIAVFGVLNFKKLKNNKWSFLEEYCKLMEPLANSLDKLQAEKRSY